MSVEAAQARMDELASRMAALRGTLVGSPALTAPAGATSAGVTSAGATSRGTGPTAFAEQLEQAATSAGVPVAAASAGRTAAGDLADRVLAAAKQHLGVPYRWGGTTPAGFDCSGFVQYVFGKHGIALPRVSKDQARAGVAVSPADAQPGDLVAFDNSRARAGVDHIGIYLGGGKWIAAPRSGDVVKISDVDLSKAVAIRRVLPASAAAAGTRAAAGAADDEGWASQLPPAGRALASTFTSAGAATGVDPRLLAAVAWSESGFSPTARSGAGAVGLMQLMPATARGLGVDPTDPAQAALGAGRYLAEQMTSFGGRLDLALAAYNAGPGAVRKHGGVPPYAETAAYVRTVTDRFRQLGGQP